MVDLEFTGERLVPGKGGEELQVEHEARYQVAGRYVGGRDVLDLGCGAGYGLAILKRSGARRVVGIDSSLNAVRYAGARFGGPGVEVLTGDCLASPLADASFDVVVSFEVVEHVEGYRRFLHEARRVLRPSGLFVFSTPNRKVYRSISDTPRNPFHVHEFDLTELRSAVAEVFPAAGILGQTRTEGAYFFGEDAERLEAEGLVLELIGPLPSGRAGRLDSAEYFFVLCGEPEAVAAAGRTGDAFCVAADDAVRRRDRRILDLQRELEERLRWVQQLEAAAEASAARVAELQARLAEERRAAARGDEERAVEQRLAALQSASAEWESYRDELERRLQGLDSARAEWEAAGPLVELSAKVAALEEGLAGVRGEIAGVPGEIAGVNAEIAGLNTEIARVPGEIAGLRAHLEAIREGEERARGHLQTALTAALDGQAGVHSELAARLERMGEAEEERAALLRWHRDSLARQATTLERQAAVAAAHEEQIRRLEQLAAEARGEVEVLRGELARQAQDVASQGERARRAEQLAESSERLIAMLWGSRSWKVYTGVRRLLGGGARDAAGRSRSVPRGDDDASA